ncbi:hypothetical protein F5144DRAFT_596177 [Chaetomium tenue]|uniref:Uncharacterized protein n=1 Tax=Chaetomium tenue TaxID=1854479 RepID=A0ACB7NV35_9PEZI|nr:hypothetical protein F5144DRAFT_596177 [Chaetomium globosum]
MATPSMTEITSTMIHSKPILAPIVLPPPSPCPLFSTPSTPSLTDTTTTTTTTGPTSPTTPPTKPPRLSTLLRTAAEHLNDLTTRAHLLTATEPTHARLRQQQRRFLATLNLDRPAAVEFAPARVRARSEEARLMRAAAVYRMGLLGVGWIFQEIVMHCGVFRGVLMDSEEDAGDVEDVGNQDMVEGVSEMIGDMRESSRVISDVETWKRDNLVFPEEIWCGRRLGDEWRCGASCPEERTRERRNGLLSRFDIQINI